MSENLTDDLSNRLLSTLGRGGGTNVSLIREAAAELASLRSQLERAKADLDEEAITVARLTRTITELAGRLKKADALAARLVTAGGYCVVCGSTKAAEDTETPAKHYPSCALSTYQESRKP